ncbi:alpha-keto acid decarboxylase family protein, partial [Bacillus thuringiensis]|nr:alpha-keto acid decarboxylase family protein [Bacillus thuringiensis]
VFGGDNVLVHDVNTSEELMLTFENIKSNSDRMHFVEVKMAVEYAPVKLSNIAKAFASQNKSS